MNIFAVQDKRNYNNMKKIVTLVAVTCMALFYACGPSAEDKAAAEKAKADSIANAERAAAEQDSLANVMKLDSIANALKLDSIAKADSIAAVKAGKKPVKKTTTPTKTTEQKNIDKMHDKKGSGTTVTPEQKAKDEKNIEKMHNKKGSSPQ